MHRSVKYCLQGFKNKGKLLDSDSFSSEKDTEAQHLEDLKNLIEDYFEEVEIRI